MNYRRKHSVTWIVGLLMLVGDTQAGILFNWNDKPSSPEVLVVTDVFTTPEVAAAFTPEWNRPVHYIVLGGKEFDIGPTWGGETMPDDKRIREELTKTLASQGYVETKIGGPIPKLALVFSYGTASRDHDIENRREMNNLIGAGKFDRKLLVGAEADQMNEAARSARLYIRVSAFDLEALRQKKKQLIWRTSISIESLRNSLPEQLSLMMAEAGPYFGKDTDRPIFRDEDDRKAKVKMGELKFLDEPVTAPAPSAKK